jgi:glycolate oxidase FAD binding subunit
VDAAVHAIGGTLVEDAPAVWRSIRDLTHPVFQSDAMWLWRISVPPNTPTDGLASVAFDWAGGQRWVFAEPDDLAVFDMAARVGGHATCYAPSRRTDTGLQPLSGGVLRLNQRVKEAMDPHGLINRGRLFKEAH